MITTINKRLNQIRKLVNMPYVSDNTIILVSLDYEIKRLKKVKKLNYRNQDIKEDEELNE